MKLVGAWRKFHGSKLLVAGAVITLVIAVLQIWQPLFVQFLNGKIYDVVLDTVHQTETTGEPVVIDIDERSLDAMGQWPWPRYRIAILLEKLRALGVTAVGVDFLFAEKDRSSPDSVRADLLGDFGVELPLDALPEALHNYDFILGDTLKGGPFVLGYKFFGTPGSQAGEDCVLHPINVAWLDSSGARQSADFPVAETAFCNHEGLARNAVFSGFFNAAPDRDGVYRRVPLIIKHDGAYHASLALATFLMSRDTNQVYVLRDARGIESVRAAGVNIPVDTFGNVLVHYRGPARTFTTLSAVDVYQDQVDPAALQGKIAFLGTSAAGLLDIRNTPLDPVFPGVEVHANVVDNIIAGDFYKRPYWMPGAELMVLLLVALVTILCLIFAKPVYALILLLAELAVLVVASTYTLEAQGLFFSPLMPAVACITVFGVLTLLKFRFAEADKAFLHGAFSKFVSEDVVAELVDRPEQLTLSGEEKELTILFSDIRSFTSISEKLSPQKIGELLNDYFTPMTAIIKQHGGTLDKYIGDAIMAFWNAPLKTEGHQTKAVRACIAQIAEMERLSAQIREDYDVELSIGIGLHTGPAMVGNMGSADLFNYTCLGDAVNLASRVEGLTKKYGLQLLVTESVVKGCEDDGIYFWEIDRVMVVGKQEPVSIYYPVDESGYAALTEEIAGFEEAFGWYKERRFAEARGRFESLAASSTLPKLHTRFADRCADLEQSPPADDWHGVHKLGSK